MPRHVAVQAAPRPAQCGSTGESPTLSDEERKLVLDTIVSQVAGRCLVLAGTGAASTKVAVQRTLEAAETGADGVMLVMPWYNRPTQAGLAAHIRAVAATGVPTLLYNNPARTGVDLAPETVVQAAHDCPSVLGMKDASGTLSNVRLTLVVGFSHAQDEHTPTLPAGPGCAGRSVRHPP